MQRWIVRSCIKTQHPWMIGTLGELTIILRGIIWRWRTVSAAEGPWIEDVVARIGSKWQARYRSGHSARRNPTIGHIPAQGNVSGFAGHVDGDDDVIEKDLQEKE